MQIGSDPFITIQVGFEHQNNKKLTYQLSICVWDMKVKHGEI